MVSAVGGIYETFGLKKTLKRHDAQKRPTVLTVEIQAVRTNERLQMSGADKERKLCPSASVVFGKDGQERPRKIKTAFRARSKKSTLKNFING